LAGLILVACSSGPGAAPSTRDAGGGTDGADAGVSIGDAGIGGDGMALRDGSPAIDDLAPVLEPIRSANGLPALAGAVWSGPQMIAAGVTGVRKLGDPTPAELGDQWHLGSDTKAMTATLVGIYVDRGALAFGDTISTLFVGETIDPGYSAVTVLELLQHRGGAPQTIPQDIVAQMVSDGSAPGALGNAVRALISRPPAQAPGTFVYANAGYMIAGAALERVTGRTWEQLLVSDLFLPLDMRSCGFGAPGTAGVVDQPRGHDVPSPGATPVPIEPGPNADNPPALGPAGTVHCSLADWGKFLALHLAGARGVATGLVTPATMRTLQTPPPGGDYACGWGVVDRAWAGGTALAHSGSNTLWYVTAWLAPAKDLTFAVVTNRGDDIAGTATDQAFGPLIQRYAP